MSTAAQILANQANAKFSAGPVTEEGKARSARNNFRHGLASGQLIVAGEDPAAFEALAEGLFDEHRPATATEENLVLLMAQHFWLGQRAIRLQNEAFAAGGSVSQLSVLLRYQTSNQRAYNRCLADLFKFRKERINGFEQQKKFEAANRPPKPREPYYIRNPKYAHLLLAHVPEAERYIKIDPNAPKAQPGTPPAGTATGFESQNSNPVPDAASPISGPEAPADQAALSSQPKVSKYGSESQIDQSAEELVRTVRETRLRPDREVAAA